MANKLRVMLHGQAFWTKGAYGLQIRHALNILQALGCEVAQSCTFGFQGRIMNAEGVTLYPMLNDLNGQDVIGGHALNWGADYVLSLGDVFVYEPELWGKAFRWLAWATADSKPLWPGIKRALTNATTCIAYSRFGQSAMQEAGYDAHYIPLCYDPNVFYPAPSNDARMEARKRLKLPTDRYIVGMIQANRNTDNRKNWFGQLEAFRAFQLRHPEAFLYLHTCMNAVRGGFDLYGFLRELGMEKGRDYAHADQYTELVIGASDDEMRDTYWSMDTLLQATKAEGFGVPALEAQACGVPVVYTNYAALPEVVPFGYPVSYDREWQPVGSWYAAPHKTSIEQGLSEMWAKVPESPAVIAAAVKPYTVENVKADYWRGFVRLLEAMKDGA